MHSVGREGDGLAKDGQAAWIVPGGLPGDVVQVRKRARRGDFQLATEVAIERPSPERVAPFCAEARCGGCALRAWDRRAVSRWKQAQVAAALGAAATGLGALAPLDEDGVLAYRHRVRLHLRKGEVGYFEPSSHRIVAIKDCPVLLPGFAARLFPFLAVLRKAATLTGELEAVFSPDEDRLVVEAVLEHNSDPSVLRSAVTGGLIDGAIDVAAKRRYGDPSVRLTHPASGRPFFLEPGVFSQANLGMNARLVRHVAAAVPEGARVLELHAGAGNLTFAYAQKAAAVLASEWDEQAIMCLRRNAETHAIAQLRLVAGGDVEMLRAHGGDFDTLVLDPPRTGAKQAAGLLTAFSQLRRIIYVSCDPSSLARDARLFGADYRLERAVPIDMFPGTPHVETVAVFLRT